MPQTENPAVWSADELENQAQKALFKFVEGRIEEGNAPYLEEFDRCKNIVERLFVATNDLLDLTQVETGKSELKAALHYLAGPPLSKDDMATFRAASANDKSDIPPLDEILQQFIDPFHFGWLANGVAPSKGARKMAIYWTAGLWAVERCRTRRRMQSSAKQEAMVKKLFSEMGLALDDATREIQALDELPRGHFTREVILRASTKADLAVRLEDGRLVAIECKVSNSAVNSVKRLNRETVGKCQNWQTYYGRQVVTAAVLSGVFKVGNLLDAQKAGVYIFWDHDLAPLRNFISANTTV